MCPPLSAFMQILKTQTTQYMFLLVAETGVILNLATELESGFYTVVLRVADAAGLEQDSTVQAEVCDCKGEEVVCMIRVAGGELPMVLGILGAILLLLSRSYN